MTTIAFETARVNLAIKHGNDIREVEWTITDADGAAWDFSGATMMTLRLYPPSGYGVTILSRGMSATVGLSIVENKITWNDLWENVGLAKGMYYYQIQYLDSVTPSQPVVVIADGYIDIQ